MKRTIAAIATGISLMLAPVVARAAVTAPVTSSVPAGTFAGTATVTQFINQNGTLYAVTSLTGTVTNLATGAAQTLTNFLVNLPVTSMSGSCTILTLNLGPLHLDLLGLVVDLNAITLDITAQSGSGNLLGNLLCAVAHLLDGNASLQAVTNLLNNILGHL